MPSEHLNTEGFVLDRSLSGENHLRFGLFTIEHGLLTCMQRRSKKQTQTDYVDLFDMAGVLLERKGGTCFVKEYRPLRRYTGIGKRYETLRLAAEWTDILSKNLRHAELFPPLYELCEEVLHAFDVSDRPDIVLLKALWKLAKDEGYAVKEHFWASQPVDRKNQLSTIIQTATRDVTASEDDVRKLLDALRRWMRAETDIYMG